MGDRWEIGGRSVGDRWEIAPGCPRRRSARRPSTRGRRASRRRPRATARHGHDGAGGDGSWRGGEGRGWARARRRRGVRGRVADGAGCLRDPRRIPDEERAARDAVQPRPPLQQPEQHRGPPGQEKVDDGVEDAHDVPPPRPLAARLVGLRRGGDAVRGGGQRRPAGDDRRADVEGDQELQERGARVGHGGGHGGGTGGGTGGGRAYAEGAGSCVLAGGRRGLPASTGSRAHAAPTACPAPAAGRAPPKWGRGSARRRRRRRGRAPRARAPERGGEVAARSRRDRGRLRGLRELAAARLLDVEGGAAQGRLVGHVDTRRVHQVEQDLRGVAAARARSTGVGARGGSPPG